MSETGVKALNREGTTGPPNGTKGAPRLFGGLGEASPPSSQAHTLTSNMEGNCSTITTTH